MRVDHLYAELSVIGAAACSVKCVKVNVIVALCCINVCRVARKGRITISERPNSRVIAYGRVEEEYLLIDEAIELGKGYYFGRVYQYIIVPYKSIATATIVAGGKCYCK